MIMAIGVDISYHRVLKIPAQLGDAAVPQFEEDAWVVCPLLLRKGLFATSAKDNFDYNRIEYTTFLSY